MKIKLLLVSTVTMILGLVSVPLVSYAASPSIYLSSNVSTVSDGGTIIVDVYMNGGGQPINAVEANLTYSTSQLEYVGLNYSGSPFNISTPGDGGGGGSVTIQNGTISPVSGSALIATVTFKALVGSGSATIGVAGSSSLISANTNTGVSFNPSGTSVSFGSAYSPPPTSYSSGSPTSSSSPSPAPTPAPAPPPTKITDVEASSLSATSATITWTTNNPTDSVVDFGLDTSYGLSDSSSTMTTKHEVQLSSSFLLPESLMHYKVQGTDVSGNVVSSSDATFQLPGLSITIVVYGPNGNPQPNALVSIDNSSGVTNSKGSVVLTAGYGSRRVTTVYQGVTVSRPISVSKDTKALTSYQLDLAKQPLNHWMVTSIVLIVLILGLLSLDALVFRSKIFTNMLSRWHRPVVAEAVNDQTRAEPEDTGLPFVPDSLEYALKADLPKTDLGTIDNNIDEELSMSDTAGLNDSLEDLSTPEVNDDGDNALLATGPDIYEQPMRPVQDVPEAEAKAAPPLKINILDDTPTTKPKIKSKPGTKHTKSLKTAKQSTDAV